MKIYYNHCFDKIGLAIESVWCEHGLMIRFQLLSLEVFLDFADHESLSEALGHDDEQE